MNRLSKYVPFSFEEDYIGNPGDKVCISSTGKGETQSYYLINSYTNSMIDVFFDTEKDAKNYAKRKKLILVEECLKNIKEAQTLYLDSVGFNFPELDQMSSQEKQKLSSVLEKRDSVVDSVMEEIPELEDWMFDGDSVYSFRDWVTSEKALIAVLRKILKSYPEYQRQLNDILKLSNTVYKYLNKHRWGR